MFEKENIILYVHWKKMIQILITFHNKVELLKTIAPFYLTYN